MTKYIQGEPLEVVTMEENQSGEYILITHYLKSHVERILKADMQSFMESKSK